MSEDPMGREKICLTLGEAFASSIWKSTRSTAELAEFVVQDFYTRNDLRRFLMSFDVVKMIKAWFSPTDRFADLPRLP